MTRRLRKWLRLVVEVVAVLAALGLALQRFALPWYVRRQVIAAAGAVNLPITSLAVRDVGLRGTELTDIVVGSKGEALRVGRVRVNYTLATLMHGALTYGVVDGLELPVALKGRQLDLGFLAQVRAGHAPGAGQGALPFQQLWLRSCTILLAHDPFGVAIPAHIHIANKGGGRVGFDAWAQAPSGWVHLIGWYDTVKSDYDFYLRADNADLRPVLDLLPVEVLSLPGRGGGTVTVSARLTRRAGRASCSLSADGRKLWYRGNAGTLTLQASDGALKLSTHLGPGYLPDALDATAHIGSLLAADRALTNLDLKVSLSSGDGQWHFQAGGDLMGIHGGVTQGVFGGWPENASDRGLSVDGAGHLGGALPPEVIAWLQSRGVSVSTGGAWTMDAAINATGDAGGSRAWRVQVHDGRISLGKTDLTLGGPEIKLRGVEGQVRFSGSVDSGGAVAVEVVPGRLVSLVDLDLAPHVAQFARNAGVATLLDVDLDAPVTVRGRLWGDGPDWQGAAGAVALRVGGAHVTALGGAVDGADVRGQVVLQGDAGPDGLRLALGPGTKFESRELSVAVNGQTLKARGVTVAPPAGANPAPILSVARRLGEWEAAAIGVPLAVSVEQLDGAFGGGVAVSAAKMTFEGTLGHAAGATRGQGRLICPDAQVMVAGAGLKLSGIQADIPISWNSPAQPDGSYAIKRIDFGANRLPGLSGSIGVAGTRADATFNWPIFPQQAFRASAWIDGAGGGVHGAFHGQLPPTRIDDPHALAGLLAPCKDMTVTGTLGAKIDLAIDGKAIVPLVHADVDNATLALPKRGITLEGIRGGLTLDSLNPLSSPGGQQLAIDKITMSKFSVTGNRLVYRIESPCSFLLEHYQGGWAGGQIATYDVRLDPAKPVLDATIFFENLQLGQMLAAVAPKYATGQGRLYGRVPIRVAWPHVAIGSGFLYAAPGGGTLQVHQSNLAPIIDQGNITDMKQNLLQALKDYQFDILSVDLIEDPRGLIARFVTSGRGHAGPVPIEVKRLTVNVIGVDSLLDVFLGLSSDIDSAGHQPGQ